MNVLNFESVKNNNKNTKNIILSMTQNEPPEMFYIKRCS